ncbi:MAG: DNA-3-methyladenine glycosylase I [Candidatus Gracilibacteria bacterium]|nr:DNA-3-methyladenine glycosylase I [Candidatus Gracilibacteria bacterium]
MTKKRCFWAENGTKLEKKYHDEEWCEINKDDKYLFEMLVLEGAQAGLSWRTILERRENYRASFDNFDIDKIINYDNKKIEELLNNPGIIRNKLKIKSVIKNAMAFKKIQEEYGNFSNYIWAFTDNKQIINSYNHYSEMPASSDLSKKISKDLKRCGMSFVGEVIIYSYLQAIGIIVDHEKSCFKYKK